MHNKYGTVVILIDEYDKPILDNITRIEAATAIRDELKNYYSVIKDSDSFLQFVFITGVSKFSKISLFSGLNNLDDITYISEYGAICGYTQRELETVFKEGLVDRDLTKLQYWYNGYNFNNPSQKVYNPFSVLLYLRHGKFKNYWFETATPTFLIQLIEEKSFFIPDMENLIIDDGQNNSFDVDSISLDVLLLQAGYITITSSVEDEAIQYYTCTFPNHEVKNSLSTHILKWLIQKESKTIHEKISLHEALQSSSITKLEQLFQAFFASIPNDWYRKISIAHYEGYYASIFYTYFTAIGVTTIPEDVTNHGRIDLTILMNHAIFIFEFHVKELNTGKVSPLDQIKKRKYAEKYINKQLPIYLIGIEFSGKERNIETYQWEQV